APFRHAAVRCCDGRTIARPLWDRLYGGGANGRQPRVRPSATFDSRGGGAVRGVVLLVLVVLACGSAVLVGPDLGGDAGRFVVWQLRVPRMLVGVLVGAMLGLVGAAFQALFQNDLATPSTVG